MGEQKPGTVQELQSYHHNIVYRLLNTRIHKFSNGQKRRPFSGKWGIMFQTLQQVWKVVSLSHENKNHPANTDHLNDLVVVEYELVERRRIAASDLLQWNLSEYDKDSLYGKYIPFEPFAGQSVTLRGKKKVVDACFMDGVRFTDGEWANVKELRLSPGMEYNPFSREKLSNDESFSKAGA